MHWLDTTLLVLLAVGAALGFHSGLLWQVARLVSLGLALFAAVYFHGQAADAVRDQLMRDADPRVIEASAYAIVFGVVYAVLLLLASALRQLVAASGLGWMDRCLGAGLGLVKAAGLLGTVCLLGSRLTHPAIEEWMTQSSVAAHLGRGMESTLALVPDDYKRNLADGLTQMKAKVPLPQ